LREEDSSEPELGAGELGVDDELEGIELILEPQAGEDAAACSAREKTSIPSPLVCH
jgi:hypothetical protein